MKNAINGIKISKLYLLKLLILYQKLFNSFYFCAKFGQKFPFSNAYFDPRWSLSSFIACNSGNYTAWKVSVFGVIQVRSFPHSDWLRRDISLHIQSECGKIRIRITPNTNTFYAVLPFPIVCHWSHTSFCFFMKNAFNLIRKSIWKVLRVQTISIPE